MTTTRRAEAPLEGTRRSPIATAVRWVTGRRASRSRSSGCSCSPWAPSRAGSRSRPCRPARWSRRSTRARRSSSTPSRSTTSPSATSSSSPPPTTGTMTVHRVAEIEQSENGPVFTTKGDANGGPDPWRLSVEGDQLHRVRVSVPLLGKLLPRPSAPATRIVLAGLGAAPGARLRTGHSVASPGRATTRPSRTWDTALDRMVHALPHPHSRPTCPSPPPRRGRRPGGTGRRPRRWPRRSSPPVAVAAPVVLLAEPHADHEPGAMTVDDSDEPPAPPAGPIRACDG